jgi:Na+-driven multidrug efflux pump
MIFPQTVIMGILKNRVFYVISTNYLIINIVLSFWFIYLFGIIGIAYATVIAYTIEKLMLVAVCRLEGIPLQKYAPIKEYILYSLITVAAYFLSLKVTMPGI